MEACRECGATEDEIYLVKCPICHLQVCEDHKYVRSGRAFCSEHCAASFFHGDDEDGLSEDD
jgi:YHS domain-containing protein